MRRPGRRRAHSEQAKRAFAMEQNLGFARAGFLELPSRPRPVETFADLAGKRAPADRRVLQDSRPDVVQHFTRKPLTAYTHVKSVSESAGCVKCVIWSAPQEGRLKKREAFPVAQASLPASLKTAG